MPLPVGLLLHVVEDARIELALVRANGTTRMIFSLRSCASSLYQSNK